MAVGRGYKPRARVTMAVGRGYNGGAKNKPSRRAYKYVRRAVTLRGARAGLAPNKSGLRRAIVSPLPLAAILATRE